MEQKMERSKKTKDTLKLALLKLLVQKPIEEITVKELCGLAEVQRGTFYRYYKNVMELQEEIKNNDINDIIEFFSMQQQTGLKISDLKKCLEFVKDKNTFLFIAYMNPEEFADFNQTFKENCIKNMSDSLGIDMTDEQSCNTLYFMFAGIYEYIAQWIKSEYSAPVEEVAQHIYVLIKALTDTVTE